MADLIDRQEAIEILASVYNDIFDDMDIDNARYAAERVFADVPSAERRGKWEITDAYPHNIYCSVCHKRYAQAHWSVWEDGSLPRQFCPNCGAKMEE